MSAINTGDEKYDKKSAAVKHIGRHTIEIVGDVITSRIFGDFTLSDMKDYYVLVKDLGAKHELYTIGDMTQAGRFPADARRYAVEHGHDLRIACSVTFGLKPAIQVMMMMVTRASQLLGHDDHGAVLKFVATEPEARAFVGAERARRKLLAVAK